MDDIKRNAKHNEGSFMYYRDYTVQADVGEAVKHNHKTGFALVSKDAAKARGRAGRFRGKNGAQENNKARGGRMAR
jgi:hypothetical protein